MLESSGGDLFRSIKDGESRMKGLTWLWFTRPRLSDCTPKGRDETQDVEINSSELPDVTS